MSLFWVAPAVMLGLHHFANTTPNQATVQPEDLEFEVKAKTVNRNIATETTTFSDGVVAIYGPTTIHADRLVVSLKKGSEHAVATGHVRLDDPDGQISADILDLNLDGGRHGVATNVMATIAGAKLTAKRADITPKLWTLSDVTLTTCRNRIPLYSVFTKELTVVPGRRGRAKSPELSLFGNHILTIPTQNFTLDRRTIGFRPPSFSYRKDRGLGVAWASGILLDEQTGVGANFAAFPNSFPGYSAQISRTWIPAELAEGLISPRSELAERFANGYLDSIETSSPESESQTLRSPRKSVSFGSSWNQGVNRGSSSLFYSKAAELSGEIGGVAGAFGYMTELRVQTIRVQHGPWLTRSVMTAAVGSPIVHVTRDLETWARLDAEGYLGPHKSGWVRGTAGLAYSPFPQIRLSGGLYSGRDFGRPEFGIDRLDFGAGYMIRADFNLGPTKFTLINKRDGKLGWWDREYSASQVVGCLEPFVAYRKSPADYRIGVKIRLDQFIDVLQARTFKRTQPAKHIISQQTPPFKDQN